MYKYLLSILAISIFACTNEKKEEAKMTYPVTKKVDSVEVRFGDTIQDPYIWLEDDKSKETEAWVEAQNKVTFDYLAKIPFRDAFKKELLNLIIILKFQHLLSMVNIISILKMMDFKINQFITIKKD